MAPRMGPAEQLVRGAAEQSECWGFKVLQFVFGDVLPRGMRSGVRLDRPNLLSGSGSAFERLTLCFIRAWSRQASAPNLPASVGPRAKPGARRLPKLSLLKGFWSCYRADSAARGGGLRISPSSWAGVRPVPFFQMPFNTRRAPATAAFFLSTLLLPPSTSRHCTTGG